MEWSTERGSVTYERLAPNVVLVRLNGHLDAGFAEHIKGAIGAVLAEGKKPHLFFDAWNATSLDTAFRAQLTPWHRQIAPRVEGQNVLVKSKILAMAITVANMAIGHILKPYNKRHEFEAAIDNARR
jgi:hypothetical protein